LFNRVSGLLAVGGLLAIGVVGALWFNLARFRDSLNWVEHTNGALHEISTTEVSLFRAESAERGWILSGDLSYFNSYRRAVQQVTTSLQVLEKSLSTDAAQRQRLEALRGLIDARLANFAQAVELGPSRRDEALAILTSERNQRRLTR
jgi:CHASE3 domain sensor protein